MIARVRSLPNFLLIACTALLLCRCAKVMVYASDFETPPVVRQYKQDAGQLYHQSKRLLEGLGYELTTADDYQYQIVTGWKPVTSASHYLDLFKRRDYSAGAGAYYQLMASFVSEGAFARVEVKTKVKSISGKLTSSKTIEKAFLARLDDAARSPQIEITNVGVENR